MEQTVDIRRFLDSEAKIIHLPQRRAVRVAVLAYLVGQFVPERIYTEREVNAICDAWHTFGDYFLLRRELVEYGFLGRERDGSRYWRVPAESAAAADLPEV